MTDTDTDAMRRDRLASENAVLRQTNAELRVALQSLTLAPVRYNDKTIEIDCFSHADAMDRVARARAILARTL